MEGHLGNLIDDIQYASSDVLCIVQVRDKYGSSTPTGLSHCDELRQYKNGFVMRLR